MFPAKEKGNEITSRTTYGPALENSNHEKHNRFYAFICAVEIFYQELLTANEYPTTKVNMKGNQHLLKGPAWYFFEKQGRLI